MSEKCNCFEDTSFGFKLVKMERGGNGNTNVGEIFWWPLTEAPGGSLYCDGSAVSRDEYEMLFEVIGTQFGEGDGSTTFKLPDMRGEFVRGYDPGKVRDPQGNTRGIGKHQDATEHLKIRQADALDALVIPSIRATRVTNIDSESSSGLNRITATTPASPVSSDSLTYTARPTNINLLPCIRYE